jgi:uroporphyrinogen decarboxylase
MIGEAMSPAERIGAAIRLEELDRTPVIIGMSGPFLCKVYGLKAAEAYLKLDNMVNLDFKLWDELGGWDAWSSVAVATYHGAEEFVDVPTNSCLHEALPSYVPGVNFPDDLMIQYEENETMKEDEYDRLIEVGWEEFFLELANRVSKKKITMNLMNKKAKFFFDFYAENIVPRLRQKGIVNFMIHPGVGNPTTTLSIWRDYLQFAIDLKKQYDKVKAAIEVIKECHLKYLRKGIEELQEVVPEFQGIGIFCARSTIRFFGRKAWEELEWPYLREAAELVLSMGKTPVFHLDGRWDECLPYFKEKLPEHKCVLQLDSNTDIFKAKEILRGHSCIYGDVSPAMLATCSPQEVESYCKKLIDVVGKDGGFILSPACYLNNTAKLENVKAIINTAKSYRAK